MLGDPGDMAVCGMTVTLERFMAIKECMASRKYEKGVGKGFGEREELKGK
jgi:hypothetical protein